MSSLPIEFTRQSIRGFLLTCDARAHAPRSGEQSVGARPRFGAGRHRRILIDGTAARGRLKTRHTRRRSVMPLSRKLHAAAERQPIAGSAHRCDAPSFLSAENERANAGMIYRRIQSPDSPPTTRSTLFWGRARIGLQWLLFRAGPLAIGINQGGFHAGDARRGEPDIQFHIATLSADMAAGRCTAFSGFTFSVCQLRPKPRSIRLCRPTRWPRPAIHANYLASETDRACVVAPIAFARRLAATGSSFRPMWRPRCSRVRKPAPIQIF